MIQRLFKFNGLFVLSFENDEIYFSKYYTPSVQIKDVSVLIDGKSSFDAPIKNKLTKRLLKWEEIESAE